jgi:hypothetical protein
VDVFFRSHYTSRDYCNQFPRTCRRLAWHHLRMGQHTHLLCLDLKFTQAALPFGGMRHGGRSFDVERRFNLLMRFEMMQQSQMPINEDISNIVNFYNYSRLQRARSDAIIVFVDVLHGGPYAANEETEK